MDKIAYAVKANGEEVEAHSTLEDAVEAASFIMDAPHVQRVFVYAPDGFAVWANGSKLDVNGNIIEEE